MVGLLVGAAAVFVGLGVFILPVWAGIRIRRHMKAKEERKRLMRERAAREMALQSIRGEDLRLGQSTGQGGFRCRLASTFHVSSDWKKSSNYMYDDFVVL